MNCPECNEYKAKYDLCIKDYFGNKLAQWDFRNMGGNTNVDQCEAVFQVMHRFLFFLSISCVVILFLLYIYFRITKTALK
jgi:hypothetical protein